MSKISKVEAYKSGWKSFGESVDLNRNPFEIGTEGWLAWNNGNFDVRKKEINRELDEFYQKFLEGCRN